jgi:hypothetical protein
MSTATSPGPVPTVALTMPDGPAPELSPVVGWQDVELVAVGDWTAGTGPAPIDRPILEALLAAAADPQVDAAAVHFGHFDPRFPARTDGEPAVGWVKPTRIENRNGRDVLLGDITDVPAGLAPVIRHGYKRRSVELAFGVQTSTGRHPVSLTGLGLLGVTPPAVKGLADLVARYSAAPLGADVRVGTVELGGDTPTVPTGLPTASHLSGHDGAVLDPTPARTEAPTVANDLDDAQLRIMLGLPVGADVTAIRATRDQLLAAQTPAPVVDPAITTTAPAVVTAPPAAAPATAPAVPAPAAAPVTTAPVAVAASAGGEQMVQVPAALLSTLQANAEHQTRDRRDGIITAALSTGRISPAEAPAWRAQLDAAGQEASVLTLLNSLTPNRVPVVAAGSASLSAAASQTGDPQAEAGFDAWERQVFGDNLHRPAPTA